MEEGFKCTPPQPQLDKLAASLAKAQAELKHPVKKNTVRAGQFSYTYADLTAVIDCVKDAFVKHGLSFVQCPSVDIANKIVSVKTILMHSSGQTLESTIQMMAKDCLPQTVGSAITYARRYALSAIAGIASEDDDDANSNVSAPNAGQRQIYRRGQ